MSTELTAEQVREAIFSGSAYASYDGAQYYANGIDMQAIADELNAALDGGECEIVASSTEGLTSNDPKKWIELSCGHSFMLYGFDAPIGCPVCGKVVVMDKLRGDA